jgi:hypothetical protein
MLRRSLLAAAGAGLAQVPALGRTGTVDVLLVLAIDASGSLSDERLTLQREGHARAVQSDAFLDAVAAGPIGRVGLAAVEWSNQDRQDLTEPWTCVEDAATARGFAAALRRAPRSIPGFTSISGAIDFATRLHARAPYAADRRVIDVSGNGTNNDGRPAAEARDAAVAAGITVNGLPILDAVRDLDGYYAREVIGGPRAFLVVARDMESFARAVLRKLLVEIADTPGRRPARRHRPVV